MKGTPRARNYFDFPLVKALVKENAYKGFKNVKDLRFLSRNCAMKSQILQSKDRSETSKLMIRNIFWTTIGHIRHHGIGLCLPRHSGTFRLFILHRKRHLIRFQSFTVSSYGFLRIYSWVLFELLVRNM